MTHERFCEDCDSDQPHKWVMIEYVAAHDGSWQRLSTIPYVIADMTEEQLSKYFSPFTTRGFTARSKCEPCGIQYWRDVEWLPKKRVAKVY